jgi:TetR/AcrR family transcriptional regulator
MSSAAAVSPSTTASSPRVLRKRARNERAIVDAAERVFRDRGYDGARIEQIAELADVSVGSIYSHFEGKRGLYSAVALRAVELFGTYMEAGYREGRTALERVLASGDAYLRFNLDHPAAFRFIALNGIEARGAELDSALDHRISRELAAIVAGFEAQVAAAIADGEAFELDASRVARFLFGAWNGVVALAMREDELRVDEAEVAEILRLGRRMVIEGLASGDVRGADARLKPGLRLVEIETPEEPG